jgi:hypothetical protein
MTVSSPSPQLASKCFLSVVSISDVRGTVFPRVSFFINYKSLAFLINISPLSFPYIRLSDVNVLDTTIGSTMWALVSLVWHSSSPFRLYKHTRLSVEENRITPRRVNRTFVNAIPFVCRITFRILPFRKV